MLKNNIKFISLFIFFIFNFEILIFCNLNINYYFYIRLFLRFISKLQNLLNYLFSPRLSGYFCGQVFYHFISFYLNLKFKY